MHLLDIAENSVKAKATLIELGLEFDDQNNTLVMSVCDNGCGMSPEFLRKVTDPFCTSRTTRKVGLGLPLLKLAAELTGGEFKIESTESAGTDVRAKFKLGHIDLMPVGDIAGTTATLIQCNPDADFILTVKRGGEVFVADTREFREILDGVPLSSPEVFLFIREFIDENTKSILNKGASL